MTRPLVLRHRGMFLLWFGQLLSQAGTKMYQIAILWWILKHGSSSGTDGSGLQLGIFMVMGALPSLALVNVIGRIVEHGAPKTVLVTSDLAAFIVVALAAWALHAGHFLAVHAYAAGLVVATAQAFFDPALNKAIPGLVQTEDLERAIELQSSTQLLSSFGGAVLGATLIGAVGIPGVAALNALSYLVSAGCNLAIQFPVAADLGTPAGPDEAGAPASDGTISGWRLLDGNPVLRRCLVGFGLVNFFVTPVLIILPMYTDRVLHASASVLGALEAALWVGMLIGNFSSSLVGFLPGAIRVAALCVGLVGAGLVVPGIVTDRWIYGLSLFVVGMSLGINNVRFMTLFQTVVAPGMRGRFFALMQAIIGFSFPAAYLVFGGLLQVWNTPSVCLLQGVGTLALVPYFLVLVGRESELKAAETSVA